MVLYQWVTGMSPRARITRSRMASWNPEKFGSVRDEIEIRLVAFQMEVNDSRFKGTSFLRKIDRNTEAFVQVICP